jgi:hypothetical protein
MRMRLEQSTQSRRGYEPDSTLSVVSNRVRQHMCVVAFVLASGSVLTIAQGTSTSTCRLEITSPHSTETVSDNGNVEGVAKNLPAGSHLWIFARRSGLAIWWPESGDEIIPDKNGRWKSFVTYGTEQDAGAQFDITAVAVDDRANADLRGWFDTAAKTGRYPGIRIPESRCITQMVTVGRR